MLAVPPHLHGVISPEITPEEEYDYPVTSIPVALQASKLKREDGPSLWSRINPLKVIYKLFPRREEPLKVRVQVPPPSPPPGFSIPNSQFLTTSAEVLGGPIPVNETTSIMGSFQKEPLLGTSPWQWF